MTENEVGNPATGSGAVDLSETLLQRIDHFLKKVEPLVHYIEPLAAMFPGVGAVVVAVDNGVKLAESVIETVDGDVSDVDGAALAAASISQSTGNGVLDARLQSIETFIVEFREFAPLLRIVFQKLGIA